jgi:hypothetical protein
MAVIYVSDATGNDGNDGSTELLAKATIGGATAIANNDDIIAVKTDGTYNITSTITVTANVTIVFYNTLAPTNTKRGSDSDLSLGQLLYPSRGLIQHDGGAYDAITFGAAATNIGLMNATVSGVPVTEAVYDTSLASPTTATPSIFIDNCHFTGGGQLAGLVDVLAQVPVPIITNSMFTGTWQNLDGKGFSGIIEGMVGGVVDRCFFKADDAEGYINSNLTVTTEPMAAGMTITNNIFTMSATAAFNKEMIRTSHGIVLFNNTFYQPSGATLGNGVNGSNAAVGGGSGIDRMMSVTNNIFQSAASGANRMEALLLDAEIWQSNYNCLFNTDNSNYTLSPTDIEEDPQFADPVNDDFTVQNKNLLQGGVPDYNGNNSQIGGIAVPVVNNNELNEGDINAQYGASNKLYGP